MPRKFISTITGIANIEDGAFANNVLCKKLRLDQNRLTEIRNNMWTGLIALESLSLEHNDIKIVEVSAFANLPNMKGLYLHDNKLTTINGNIFPLKQMPAIHILTLHENKLQREELDWLRDLCENGQIEEYTITGDDISCTRSSNDNDNLSNNYDTYTTTTVQPEKYLQGKPRILM